MRTRRPMPVLPAALKLPKETDAERAARSVEMRERGACRVRGSADVRRGAFELVGAAEALAGRSNVNASSDLNVAAPPSARPRRAGRQPTSWSTSRLSATGSRARDHGPRPGPARRDRATRPRDARGRHGQRVARTHDRAGRGLERAPPRAPACSRVPSIAEIRGPCRRPARTWPITVGRRHWRS